MNRISTGMLPSSGELDWQTGWASWQWTFKRRRRRRRRAEMLQRRRRRRRARICLRRLKRILFWRAGKRPRCTCCPLSPRRRLETHLQSAQKALHPQGTIHYALNWFFSTAVPKLFSYSTQGFIFDSVDSCETTPTEEKRGFGERGSMSGKV